MDSMFAVPDSKDQMIAVSSLMNAVMRETQLTEAFMLTQDDLPELIRRAEELSCVQRRDDGWLFFMPDEKIRRQKITPELCFGPLYYVWEKVQIADSFFETMRARLCDLLEFSYEESIRFFNQLGFYAEKKHNINFASVIYEHTVALSREADPVSRKYLFVRSALNVSKLEFMRGLSPIKTLRYQQEALKMVHQANLTAEDALLMLYAGMSEHFSGSFQEGYILREKGIKYLKQFNHADIEAESMPLVGWHYYLLGNFKNAIAYYESMILAIENKEDSDIIAFSYPPIIFSYMFLGEYHRALILSEIIYHNALEAKDHFAATLMLANTGRTYVYMDDIDYAETVLYQAYAEALQEDYGWGLYYTLLGICCLQLKKHNYYACREALFLACKAAQEHNFRAINASPFVIDVLKMIEDRGLEPIEGLNYKAELQNWIASDNIHLAGVARRHLALLKKETGRSTEEVLQDLKRSIQLLDESGNGNELAETYRECARIFRDMHDREKTKKYAQLAWLSETDAARKLFPRDLIGFVQTEDLKLDLPIILETAWLELRHIIHPQRLVARLLTTVCRQLKTESAAFIQISSNKYQMLLSQNVEKEKHSPQYQRVMAIVSHTADLKDIFVVQNKELGLGQQGLDLKRNPRFIMCIPFLKDEKVGAALYLESYYKESGQTAKECEMLMAFSKRLSEHLFVTLNYEDFRAASGRVESGSEVESRLSETGSYCPSIDEAVALIQAQITKIAKTKIPVLIIGETGVGKEIFSGEIFEQSNYKKSFVKVNCGAIPESLIESELFGYERGSFTGAAQQKKGYFELAEGGTLFLDEIGELTLQTQVKLLRVLQEHEFIRVGGTKTVKVDFRLIAATNKDLKEEVEKGTFRKDLYYRLNVMQLAIPPLRERKTDIANMAKYFAEKFCLEFGRPTCQISSETLVSMLEYPWPGNVRELENTIQRVVLLTEGDVITGPLLPQEATAAAEIEQLVTLEEMERKYILKVLHACGGKIAGQGGAAEILGLKRTTLNSKMEKLGIKNVNYYDL